MVNRLAAEKSPYLLQHADNPVDWFPWGPEAFDEARRRDVPVFVSVGYSSCHWCHVMAHESFEDDDVAALLNERFVSVKVDREERPDVDAVYMSAVQALTGHGGWPMSVFTTPDGKPFYAGTYWPRESRQGLVGFPQVATAVADAWAERREEVLGSADEIAVALSQRQEGAASETLDLAVSDEAANLLLEAAWDRELGGFVSGGARLPEARRAPKFPQAMTIEYLLARHARTGEDDVLTAATHSLDAMARGGIHDQVGGGFARYSTDARWLVPHFEKMLYDNALLLSAYATAHALTGEDGLGRVARSTADYLLREMRHPEGGFYAATDADSEGVEGKFFVWSDGELREVLSSAGLDADRFARFFGVTAAGNFSPEHPGLTHDGGANILHEPVPRHVFADAEGLGREVFAAEVERAREALYARRGQRVPPGLDDKVLTSWNALVVRGLARAGAYLDEPRYLDAARDTAEFLATHLVVDGHLRHTYKEGTASVPAFLEDVALLAGALLELFELGGELRWFEWARELAEDAVARFHDDEAGAYFQTATDAESLYHRPKETWDNAQPSGNSALAEAFAKLAGLTGEPRWHERVEEILRLLQDGMRKAPPGYGHALQVVERLLAGPRELAIVGRPGPARDALAAVAQRGPLPGAVVVVAAPGSDAVERVPLLHARTEVDGRPAAYVCRNLSCDRPVTTPDELGDALAGALEGS